MDCSKLPYSVRSVSLVFTDDASIQVLNAHYRRKNKPTDVLSFSQIEGLENDFLTDSLGDLVISLETAAAQAKEYGVTLDMEVLRLLIHGILHLFGYDHENVSRREAQKMRRIEDKLLKLLATRSRDLFN